MNPNLDRRAGCVSGGLGAAVVVLLAPFAYAVRVYRGWRRGSEILVEHSSASPGTLLATIDVPNHRGGELRTALTDTVIRIAEKLRSPDDVYHQVYRERGLDETTVLPVGPLLQELGERLSLALGHGPLAGRTVVWITLPRGLAPVELLNPLEYDPEAEGEPEKVMRHADLRWGMATTFVHTGPSVVYRVVFFVPAKMVRQVEGLLERLNR
jgi:hypothetical protein